MDESLTKGIAFILEGDTEKEFYWALLNHFCSKHPGSYLNRIQLDDDIYYHLKMSSSNDYSILIKPYVLNSISNISHAAAWFKTQCRKKYSPLNWTVFLCYDTDSYNDDITKFYEGDWSILRKKLKPAKIIDLSAKADIEDIMLLDENSIFKYLGIEPREIPNGKKGKTRLKRLFRCAGSGVAYHSGTRAKELINSLDFDLIISRAPINLTIIETICFPQY